MSEIKILEIVDAKSPEYRYVYVTGVFGGLDSDDARMFFFLDRLQPETSREPLGETTVRQIIRELQVEVHMSPAQFKRTAIWMMNHVARFEKSFGPITLEPKKPEVSADKV